MFITPSIVISVQSDSGKKKIKVCDKHFFDIIYYITLYNKNVTLKVHSREGTDKINVIFTFFFQISLHFQVRISWGNYFSIKHKNPDNFFL